MSSEDLECLHNIWIKFLNTKNTKVSINLVNVLFIIFIFDDVNAFYEFFKLIKNVFISLNKDNLRKKIQISKWFPLSNSIFR